MEKWLHWLVRRIAILVVICTTLPLLACNDTPTPPAQETTDSDFESTAPVSAPITEPVTEPGTDPITEPATEPVTEPEPVKALAITGGTGEVYPYIDEIKSYLKAPVRVNVANYAFEIEYPAQAIRLEWKPLVDNIEGYTLRYFPVGHEQDTIEVSISKNTQYYELYNLYKACDYEWSITAKLDSGEDYTEKATFHTSDLGPRILRIRAVYNTRDAGGYVTESGLVTKQGMIIRGSALPESLPEHAQKVFTETLGIKTELDVRGYTAESGFRAESPIEGAKLEQIQIEGYSDAFKSDWAENYRQIFSLMADPENYPIYIHCTAGADRTGTVIYLLNALLGVPEEQLIQDYELTSFSKWGTRSTYDPDDGGFGSLMAFFQNRLNRQSGDTLAEKAESYMLSIGVTQEEIDSIRSIMLENPTTQS